MRGYNHNANLFNILIRGIIGKVSCDLLFCAGICGTMINKICILDDIWKFPYNSIAKSLREYREFIKVT